MGKDNEEEMAFDLRGVERTRRVATEGGNRAGGSS